MAVRPKLSYKMIRDRLIGPNTVRRDTGASSMEAPMNSLRVNLPILNAIPRAQRHLLLAAAIVGASILALYVNLLHDAVARGGELQRTFTSRVPAKATLQRSQIGSAQRQTVTVTADAATR